MSDTTSILAETPVSCAMVIRACWPIVRCALMIASVAVVVASPFVIPSVLSSYDIILASTASWIMVSAGGLMAGIFMCVVFIPAITDDFTRNLEQEIRVSRTEATEPTETTPLTTVL